MPRGEYLGEFEQMVMLSVARLEEGAYGIAILEEMQHRTGVEVAVVRSGISGSSRPGRTR